MKVTICIGNNKWAIPYSDKDKVGDILQLAVNRYMNYNPKNMDKVIGACHFLTLDGAILYNDDNLCDVIDNNDTIKVAFREDVDLNETETESSTPAEFPDAPRFNKVSSKLAHLQTPPIPPFQNKFSTGPRHKSTGSSKTPDRFKSREEMVASFSRLGGRKSLGSNLMHDHWFEARYKLQGRLETLEDSNNNNSSQSLLDSCSQANNNNMSSKHSQSDLTNLTPANRSSSLLAINQSQATTLPPSPPTSKGVGSRPRSAAVKGYVTEFRGREVSTRTLESTKEGGSDLSSLKKKNQSPAVLAPSNTRVIGKMMNITLVKGSSGLGFTITSRDNMAEMNSPIYIKNILPGGAAQLDGRLKILDRLLAVNGVDVSNAKQTEATQILRQIPIGQGVELLISRQVEDGDINEGKIATHENLPAPLETTEDHHHHHDEEKLHPSYDTNSFRQPSMTKEMEKFLSSSVSPPCHPLNNEWNVPLKQFLPHSKCNLRPLMSEGKVVAMLIRSSPSSPELQLLEIDGQPLTPDLSVSASIDLIKRAINKAWFQEGSNVMARVRKPCLGFFDSYPEESAEVVQEDHLTLPASMQSSKGHRNRVQEVKKSPSKSAPTTPIAAKQLRFPPISDVGEVEREEEGDHEEGQEGSTFDRKGFGRQSMSEKRKGHADPRSLDFYRQMKNEKNDGRTSYATWDTRKTSRLKKLAADANLKNNSEASSCSDKQYKSMENLLANQNAVVSEHPMAEQVNDLDMNDAKQGRMGEIDENKKVDGDDDDLHGRSDGRSGKKVTRICRDKKSRSAIAQEHKKFISKMRQAVENLRLSPKIDTPLPTPFTTPLASPISATQTSVVAKLPPRPSLRSDAPTKGDLDRSGSSDGTPPPEKDSEKSNPASALKFSFRSLPKKFNKTSWPFMSKVKGEGGQDVSPDGVGMPGGRLQPEGKEETTRANVTPMDPRFSASSSSSSSHPRHKTLAHIPVLRVGETSNIYKDIAQQQQLQEELSWQRQEGSSWQHQPDLQSPQYFGEQSRTGDWHAHQRSPFVHHQHDYDSPHHHHHHHHNMTSSHPYDSSQHHRHPPPQFENTDEPMVSHRPQRSYDGSTFTPPSSRSLTTVSLKMKPHDGWYSQGISSNDCKGCMVYTPEIQYKTYVGSKGSPKYVTTLKVNCDEEVGNSIHSPDENAFGFHLVQSPQNFHKDVAWTRSARV